MISVRTTTLTSQKNMSGARFSELLLLFIMGKYFVNQNDVEFDFSIGHAFVLFPFLRIINKR